MVEIYRRTSRQTGRTTMLVESLRDGDRVISANRSMAAELRRRISEKNLSVEVVVIEPSRENAHAILAGRRSERRTIFDHTFVEEYLEKSIKEAATEIEELQNMVSREPERLPHIELAHLNRARFEL